MSLLIFGYRVFLAFTTACLLVVVRGALHVDTTACVSSTSAVEMLILFFASLSTSSTSISPPEQPNAIARIVSLESTKKIIIVAKRNIKPGEEVRSVSFKGERGGF